MGLFSVADKRETKNQSQSANETLIDTVQNFV